MTTPTTARIDHPPWCSLRRCRAVRTPAGPHRSALHLLRERRFDGRDGAVLVTLALEWAPNWRGGPAVQIQLVGLTAVSQTGLQLDEVRSLIDALGDLLTKGTKR
jgi:hypothetical protein